MYKAIAANKRNTFLIMALFVGLIAGIGWIISSIYGEPSIAYWTIGGVLVYALIQYYAAGSLAVATTGAVQIEKRDNPRLYRTVENISITLGTPMPKVYIIKDAAPNAFATGRDPQHAIVAATTGLLDIMDDRELEAVMAHEMGHVQNYDIRVSMIAFGLTSAIALLSDIAIRMLIFGGDRRGEGNNPLMMIIGLIAVILAPLIAMVIQFAISRQREYLADATGVMTTRDVDGLVGALGKLKDYGKPMQRQNSASAHLFISNPLKKSAFSSMLSTHPPLEDRIKRLKEHGYTF